MMLFDHHSALSLTQSSVGKHTNLLSDMIPAIGFSFSVQIVSEHLPHFSDSLSHAAQLGAPQLAEFLVVHDKRGQSGTSSRIAGRLVPRIVLNFGSNPTCHCHFLTYKMNCSDRFTVKTHDFAETLSNSQVDTLVHKVSQSFSIFVQVTRHKSLISGIKNRIKVFHLTNFGNTFPLF